MNKANKITMVRIVMSVMIIILLLFPFFVRASSMYQEIDILENGNWDDYDYFKGSFLFGYKQVHCII